MKSRWFSVNDVNDAIVLILIRTGQRVEHWQIEVREEGAWFWKRTRVILHAVLEDGTVTEREM